MGSLANSFVSRSLILVLFLSLGYLALPESPAAQGPAETVILKQREKEATRVLQQLQREAARAQAEVKLRQHVAGEFAILQVKAKEQQTMLHQWHNAHSSESDSWSSTEARGRVHKKRFRCSACL